MASEDEEIKVVRCSLSELKELAKTLEMQRSKHSRTVSKIAGKSAKLKSSNLKEERVCSGSSGQKQNVRTSQCNDQQPIKKQLNSNGKLYMDLENVKEKKGSIPTEQKKKQVGKKCVSFTGNENIKSRKTRQNMGSLSSDYESDNDYSRGESPYSKSPKCLYDPLSNSSPSKLVPIKSEITRSRADYQTGSTCTHEEVNKVDISDKINKLCIISDNENSQLRNKEKGDNEEQNLKKAQRKKAEMLFMECNHLEGGLNNVLTRRLSSEKQLNGILKISKDIQEKCKQIMITDLYFFTTKEVYNLLWKSGIYQVIEKLRALQKNSKDYDHINDDLATKISSMLHEYLNSAEIFIEGMIGKLEEQQNFSLKSFVGEPTNYDDCHRLVKMALLSCHHFMIFLGDIERYKQNLSSSKEWSLARSRYLKASKIAPRNGKPYNQLAVVAVYAKRRLDAVYYYVRSLTVSNPIMTAREKLHAIFDDVQRKAYELHVNYQEVESGLHCSDKKSRLREKGRKSGTKQSHRFKNQRNGSDQHKKTTSEGRHELWVFYQAGVRHDFLFTPDGLIMEENTHHEEHDKHHTKISLNEISKQFEIFFLCSHAMLYSKVCVDRFTDNHCKVLGLFKTLLRHPNVVGAKRLIEIMAINMFEIANLTCEDFDQFFEGTPLDLAVNLGCDMFQCLCEASLEILQQHSDTATQVTLDDDLYHAVLANFLPALKVWFDWMKNNITLLRTSSVSIKEDFWSCISALLNSLIKVYVSDEFADKPSVGDFIVSLTEDDHLSGFKLLAHASKPRAKVADLSKKVLVCQRLRIVAMQGVARFLCEFEDLPLRIDEISHHYYVTEVALTSETTNGGHDKQYVDEIDEEDIEDDVIVESVEDFDSDVEVANPVKELKAKKDALTKEIMSQKQREDDKKAVLVEHSSKPTLVLEITPEYLVPDTNCFIDHLPQLQSIVETKHFTFVIPLVVINELDGLAKGVLSEENGEQLQHTEYVAERSRAAIDFLEYCFSLSDSQMLALTSKGSVLTTIAFRTEEPIKGRGINDDVILNCCHHYCDSKMDVVNKLASPDQPFTIRRKVVLVTEDRNLRLKAHVQNIPVITVPQFLEMITS